MTVYVFPGARALLPWPYASLHGGTGCVFQVAVLILIMQCLYKAIYGCFYQVNILEVYVGGG